MENRVLPRVTSMEEYPANDVPQNIFTVSWSREAERPFRHTHPKMFFCFCFFKFCLPLSSSKLRTTKKGTHSANTHEIHTGNIKCKEHPFPSPFKLERAMGRSEKKKGWLKRHQSHTCGLVHSAYILALLWVKRNWCDVAGRYQASNMDIHRRVLA